MGLNTTPATWVAGTPLTATQLNVQVRDAFTGLQDVWDIYGPTWGSSGTPPAIGDGSILGRFMQVGRTIHYSIVLIWGTTTTAGTGQYTFTLPTTARQGIPFAVGIGTSYDTSGTVFRPHHVILTGAAGGFTVGMINDAGSRVGATSPYTWATGDTINLAGTYETP